MSGMIPDSISTRQGLTAFAPEFIAAENGVGIRPLVVNAGPESRKALSLLADQQGLSPLEAGRMALEAGLALLTAIDDL